MSHVFFASYARADDDDFSKLGKVLTDLDRLVAAKVGAQKGLPVGFIDVASILTGDDWQTRLSKAVHEASVLVCMLSPRFYNSQWCAKEYDVFRRRLAAIADPRPLVVIPVLWERGATRAGVVDVKQFKDARFPKRYREEGLASLRRLRSRQDTYRQTLDVLAEIIREGCDARLPALVPTVAFGELPNAFDNPGGAYDMALVSLHPHNSQWVHGTTGSSVARDFDDVASTMKVHWKDVPTPTDPAHFSRFTASIAACVRERRAVVVVTDDRILDAEPMSSLAARVDSVDGPIAVLVGSATPGDETAAHRRFPLLARGSDNVIDTFVLGNHASLRSTLERAMTRLRTTLVAADPAARVDHLALQTAAAEDGVPITTRPMIVGPGGAR